MLGAFAQTCFRDDELALALQLLQPAPHDRGHELEEVHILDQVVERAALHHLHGHAHVALAGDDDERNGAARVGQRADEFPALDVAQLQVEQEEVGGIFLQPGERIGAGSGRGHVPLLRP